MIQVGEFYIDMADAIVYQGETLLEVEPKTYELLLYFVERPQQLISRDDLIKDLWQGRVISDNTLNKHIANLRKLLNDNPKQPTYVETVSKKGYRFICAVNTLESKVATNESTNVKLSKLKITLMLVCALLVLVAIKPMFSSKMSPVIESYEVTRADGIEFSPRSIANTSEVLYLQQKLGRQEIELWHKNLESNQVKKVALGQYRVHRLVDVLNNEKDYEVYFVGDGPNGCNLYRAAINNDFELIDPESIFECGSFKLYDIVYSQQEKAFYYTAMKFDEPSYQLYKYEIKANLHKLAQQPNALGSGNQSIDLSPNGERLLIMNINTERLTTFYVLDLKKQKLTKHKSLNYLVTEAIWDHDSEHIIYSAPPPSHQILRSELESEKETTLVNVSHYLSNDMKLYQSNQMLFATRQVNFSNEMIFADQSTWRPNNSVVYDTLPALFHNQKSYFFISNRSGKSQLYFGDLISGESNILSSFSDHNVFKGMQVSPDDELLLLYDQNRVWQLPIKQILNKESSIDNLLDYQVLDSQHAIYNVNWLSNEHFVVSVRNKDNPHLIFEGKRQQTVNLLPKWQYLFADHSRMNGVYLVEKGTGRVFRTSLPSLLNDNNAFPYEVAELKRQLPFDYFDPQMFKNNFYYVTAGEGQFYINKYSLTQQRVIQSLALDGYYEFDVSELGVMLSHLTSAQGDLHRAVFH